MINRKNIIEDRLIQFSCCEAITSCSFGVFDLYLIYIFIWLPHPNGNWKKITCIFRFWCLHFRLVILHSSPEDMCLRIYSTEKKILWQKSKFIDWSLKEILRKIKLLKCPFFRKSIKKPYSPQHISTVPETDSRPGSLHREIRFPTCEASP